MTGFRDFVADGKTLSARGFRGRPVDACLIYHFVGDFAAGHPTVSLTATTDKKLDGQIELALSTDAKQWDPSRRDHRQGGGKGRLLGGR